jgi:hypothetical protein
MPHYRVYTLDDAGKFIAAREVEAASDHEAMEMVRLYPDDIGFEVWTGARKVGQVGREKIVVLAVGADRLWAGKGG